MNLIVKKLKLILYDHDFTYLCILVIDAETERWQPQKVELDIVPVRFLRCFLAESDGIPQVDVRAACPKTTASRRTILGVVKFKQRCNLEIYNSDTMKN